MIRKPSPLAFAVALALAAPVTHAQETSRSDAQTLDTLIVTGTRVADRTVAESTAPIDIITPEVLQSTGTVELATALSRAVPSLNFPRAAINDGAYYLEQAKALFAEADVDSFKLNIWVPELPRPFLPDPVGAAERVAKDLSELGLDAQARAVPLRQFLRDRETGRYTAWIIGWEAQSPDPDNFWFWHFGIADRVVAEGHYDNRVLAQALAQAQRADTDSRRQIYEDAARTVDQDTARIFLVNNQNLVLTSRRLRGLQPGPMGIDSFAALSLGEPETAAPEALTGTPAAVTPSAAAALASPAASPSPP